MCVFLPPLETLEKSKSLASSSRRMHLSEAPRVTIAHWKTTLGDFRLKSLHCKSVGRRRDVFISRYMSGIKFAFGLVYAVDSISAGFSRTFRI